MNRNCVETACLLLKIFFLQNIVPMRGGGKKSTESFRPETANNEMQNPLEQNWLNSELLWFIRHRHPGAEVEVRFPNAHCWMCRSASLGLGSNNIPFRQARVLSNSRLLWQLYFVSTELCWDRWHVKGIQTTLSPMRTLQYPQLYLLSVLLLA